MPETTAQPNLKFEIALLVLLAGLWGSSYLFLKIALESIPPVTVIAIRVSVAAVLLAGVLVWLRLPLPRDWSTWKHLFVQALLGNIGAWTILAWGQQYIDSALATVLNSTSPIFVFFLTLFLTRHERTNPLRFLGACLGLLGVTLIVGVDALAGLGQQVAGQLAALFGAFLYGCAAIYGTRFKQVSPFVVAAGTLFWSTAVLAPAAVLLEAPDIASFTTRSMAAALALGLFCTGCALMLYFRLVQTLGSMGVASQAYLRIGFGVMLGIVFLDEQFTLIVGLGIAVAAIGVAAINLPERKSASQA